MERNDFNRKIVWQPTSLYQEGHNFGIILDREFAKEMLSAKLDEGSRRRMNDLAHQLHLSGINTSPLLFYEDTAFVFQFSIGTGGKWLATDETLGKNPLEVFRERPITYSSHNLDTMADAYDLLRLVDFWVYYSDALTGQDNS